MKYKLFIKIKIISGTKEERGLSKWRETLEASQKRRKPVQYNMPFVTRIIKRIKCCVYFPISPTFSKSPIACCKKAKKQKAYELDVVTTDFKPVQQNGSGT